MLEEVPWKEYENRDFELTSCAWQCLRGTQFGNSSRGCYQCRKGKTMLELDAANHLLAKQLFNVAALSLILCSLCSTSSINAEAASLQESLCDNSPRIGEFQYAVDLDPGIPHQVKNCLERLLNVGSDAHMRKLVWRRMTHEELQFVSTKPLRRVEALAELYNMPL